MRLRCTVRQPYGAVDLELPVPAHAADRIRVFYQENINPLYPEMKYSLLS
jgi:hypothetical protein